MELLNAMCRVVQGSLGLVDGGEVRQRERLGERVPDGLSLDGDPRLAVPGRVGLLDGLPGARGDGDGSSTRPHEARPGGDGGASTPGR